MGIWATPVKLSMLPRVMAGSKENLSRCWSLWPVYSSTNFWRALTISGVWSLSLSWGTVVRLTFSAIESLTLKEREPNGVVSKSSEISCCPLSSWPPRAWMLTTLESGKAMAEVGLTPLAATRSPFVSRGSRSSGTGLPAILTSLRRVRVALDSRFLRLNRTPSSTFSRLPRVYICFRTRPGISMRGSSRILVVGTRDLSADGPGEIVRACGRLTLLGQRPKFTPLQTSLTALEGRIFTSLGFQPQVGGRQAAVFAPRHPRLGVEPPAIQSPPFQGGPPCPPPASPRTPTSMEARHALPALRGGPT